jgi:hypothetical protein
MVALSCYCLLNVSDPDILNVFLAKGKIMELRIELQQLQLLVFLQISFWGPSKEPRKPKGSLE